MNIINQFVFIPFIHNKYTFYQNTRSTRWTVFVRLQWIVKNRLVHSGASKKRKKSATQYLLPAHDRGNTALHVHDVGRLRDFRRAVRRKTYTFPVESCPP